MGRGANTPAVRLTLNPSIRSAFALRGLSFLQELVIAPQITVIIIEGGEQVMQVHRIVAFNRTD